MTMYQIKINIKFSILFNMKVPETKSRQNHDLRSHIKKKIKEGRNLNVVKNLDIVLQKIVKSF